ncbi:hypothetical protein U27_01465 [Candidatus Vecturithrix granuli]|uniref:Uncharacterized protein n=1 Tax=Vecturithrix granuli TaxID=1499967 RepID=A0A081CAF9_VECG1|nr:hypothetical protein U27_01465 [Candidatus Vecturithrix granuli]
MFHANSSGRNPQDSVESFQAFKKSFSYGSRSDLNFKFWAGLPDEEAGQFFQELLWKLGDAADDGAFGRLLDLMYAWQVRGYAGESTWNYDDGPFTPLGKPLKKARLALLTSSGHFVEGDDPQPFGVPNMSQDEAMARIGEFLKQNPTLSVIPATTPNDRLRVRHGGYDIRGAQRDPNVALPLERLREIQQEGLVGELAPDAAARNADGRL